MDSETEHSCMLLCLLTIASRFPKMYNGFWAHLWVLIQKIWNVHYFKIISRRLAKIQLNWTYVRGLIQTSNFHSEFKILNSKWEIERYDQLCTHMQLSLFFAWPLKNYFKIDEWFELLVWGQKISPENRSIFSVPKAGRTFSVPQNSVS